MGHHDLRIVESFGDNSTSVLSREGTTTHSGIVLEGEEFQMWDKNLHRYENKQLKLSIGLQSMMLRKRPLLTYTNYLEDILMIFFLIFRSLCANTATTTGRN